MFTYLSKRRYIVQQPGTKSVLSPGDKLQINFGFCFSPGLNENSFVGACEETLRFMDMPCIERVYREKTALEHWSTASNEERSRSR